MKMKSGRVAVVIAIAAIATMTAYGQRGGRGEGRGDRSHADRRQIGADEITAIGAPPRMIDTEISSAEKIWRGADVDGDDTLSQKEFIKLMKEMYAKADIDSDARLTPEEIAGMWQMLNPYSQSGPRGPRGPGGHAGMPGGGGRGPQQGPDPEAMMQHFDGDGDGKIAKDEARGGVEKNFDKIDADQDGFISLDELSAMRDRAPRGPGGADRPRGSQGGDRDRGGQQGFDPQKVIGHLDSDGDGKISKDEAPEQLKKRFDKLDQDGDGALSAEELAPIAKKMMKGQRQGEGGGRQGGHGGGGGMMSGMIDRFDQDGDGKISKDEAQGPVAEYYDIFDANGDGQLEPDEIAKGFQAMQEELGGEGPEGGGGRGGRGPRR